jgi:hypothetical protein
MAKRQTGLARWNFLYELWTGLYMLDAWEKSLFSEWRRWRTHHRLARLRLTAALLVPPRSFFQTR